MSTAFGDPIRLHDEVNSFKIFFLRQTILWRFVVEDVTMSLLGIDVLSLFNLFIDYGNGRLLNQVTFLEEPAPHTQLYIISVVVNPTSSLPTQVHQQVNNKVKGFEGYILINST